MRRILTILMLVAVSAAAAQERFDHIFRRNPWNGGLNAAGIRQDSLSRSYAEIYFTKENGGLAGHSASDDSWNAGAKTESVRHLKKVSFSGGFGYDYFDGRNMCGSMFIRPGYYPVDVLEFTPGDKTLQTYMFSGGIAVPLNDRLTVGAKMDFESDNYAKRKDIRHTNYRLDMTVTPSAVLRLDKWTVGAAMIFSKNSESIQAEQIGTATADSYYAFLDKGMMYGVQQVWNGSGIHLSESGLDRFAVKEYSYGASAQIERPLADGALYADIEWLASSGGVGEKSYTFFRFPGRSVTARLGYRHETGNGTNIFRIRYNWFRQWNNEYVIDKVPSGGVTVPVTYGHNRIFERRRMRVATEYSFYGTGQLSWLYRIHAEAGYAKGNELSSAVYPYSFKGNEEIVSASAAAQFRLGRFRLGCGLDFLKGFRDETAGMTGEGADHGASPFRPESWYNLWNEWENAARLGAALSLRYDFSIGKTRGLYAEVSCSWLHGFDIVHCGGSDRSGSAVWIGYEF